MRIKWRKIVSHDDEEYDIILKEVELSEDDE